MEDLSCIIIGIYLSKSPITDACIEKKLSLPNIKYLESNGYLLRWKIVLIR